MQQAEPHYDFLQTPRQLTLRCGRWRCRPEDLRGTVLILQGRSEFMEKYEETAIELVKRGLDVLSFDWRGQGLSDRMLPESEKGYVRRYEDYLEDLDYFVHTRVVPNAREPIFMLSHSMGGHIGLRYLHQFQHPFAKAIFSAPMIDVQTGPIPSFFIRWLSRRMVARGYGDRVVIGSSRSTPFPGKFTGNRLTSDRGRFERTSATIEKSPQLSAAQVTYGWLAATFDSIAFLNQPHVAPSLSLPMLFFCAERDRIVSKQAVVRFSKSIKNARLAWIEKAQHEILQETDPVRDAFWRSFDDFMVVSNRVPTRDHKAACPRSNVSA